MRLHKVHPDLLDAGFAARIVCRHDHLATLFEAEMIASRNMPETHHVVAALNEAILMTTLARP